MQVSFELRYAGDFGASSSIVMAMDVAVCDGYFGG